MQSQHHQTTVQPGDQVGLDIGSSLVKLATRPPGGPLALRLLGSTELDAFATSIDDASTVGLTGSGAGQWANRIPNAGMLDEFQAWHRGAGELLQRADLNPADPHLLVSVGTGTSILLASQSGVTRIGGTALGGGSIVGLGSRLLGTRDFDEIVTLAKKGAREPVDLMVSDLYAGTKAPLSDALTAASFAKLALSTYDDTPPRREDLARALIGMVGDSIALMAGTLAAMTQAQELVFAGTTLRGNSVLTEILEGIGPMLGRKVTFLDEGEYAGAVGALLLASQES